MPFVDHLGAVQQFVSTTLTYCTVLYDQHVQNKIVIGELSSHVVAYRNHVHITIDHFPNDDMAFSCLHCITISGFLNNIIYQL